MNRNVISLTRVLSSLLLLTLLSCAEFPGCGRWKGIASPVWVYENEAYPFPFQPQASYVFKSVKRSLRISGNYSAVDSVLSDWMNLRFKIASGGCVRSLA